MNIIEAITHIDALKPNSYGPDEKIKWLSILDGTVKNEIIDTHEGGEEVTFSGYNEMTPPTQDLLVPHPYDDVYIKWLEAQIDYAAGEYGKYNNSITMFNTTYNAFARYYHGKHKPIAKKFTHF